MASLWDYATETLCYEWSIPKFNDIKENFIKSDAFFSPPFKDWQWYLRLYPDGYDKQRKGKLSIYVFPKDLDTTRMVSYKLEFVKANNETLSTEESTKTFDQKGCGVGFPQLISRANVQKILNVD